MQQLLEGQLTGQDCNAATVWVPERAPPLTQTVAALQMALQDMNSCHGRVANPVGEPTQPPGPQLHAVIGGNLLSSAPHP